MYCMLEMKLDELKRLNEASECKSTTVIIDPGARYVLNVNVDVHPS